MGHDHEGQRVSRRSLVRGITALGFGGVLAACAKDTAGTSSAGGGGAGAVPGGAAPGGGAPPSGGGGGGAGAGGGAADLTPTDDKRYLRGAQVTNSEGIVQFTTIWPGWYRGRTVHIHAMVHVSNTRVLTTQIMFDETLNTKVFQQAPYASHTGRDTLNDNDSIYKPSMLMKVAADGDGYLGAIVFGVDSDQDGT